MKIIDTQQVCPYTGLRSFTEEESLYFKGRDLQVDQITALLEKNKFLMVTGASGEGKSSLIFAGLIPNARAGFFKAKYTNWVVADFRPERSPVRNMSLALAEKFDRKPEIMETELRRGFSSLVDLYTNSEFFVDENELTHLSEGEQKDKKRKAANLMVLVDQFEEFFTNPENFFNEAPSQDSQIVVNLILETARIAIKRNLPVYIVCTMRSDYIGQCSAFRGLPEYIGFSQFFVPRLKRKDLKQVVEEPAILSGNRISQRLIERLVYDLSEGVDQLPILQHALSQIWLAADRGQQEMDLVHYAMVGGMPAAELPDEDQRIFQKWFASLPAYQQKYYHETGLSKVIEIHASVLYENAWSYYNKQNPDKPITQHEAKRIIGLSFSCLTKIDNSRAVRNRMSLEEITAIINTPELTTDVVGRVLNIFREEGNSFIRPFITEDPTTRKLQPDTVLDITHESLIRNWDKLNQWASREYEYYTIYLDFRKQLDRWKASGKQDGFLLPIGPLTFFENWYQQSNPNAGWIKRYAEIQEDQEKANHEAVQVLADIQEFLNRSARKVMVTRAFMKYGTQRIATGLAIIILLVLSGFYWYDAEQKTNERVISRLVEDARPLLKSQEAQNFAKSVYLLMEERAFPGSMIPYLQQLGVKDRIALSVNLYRMLLELDKHFREPLKDELLALLVSSMDAYGGTTEPDFLLTERNRFMVHLVYDEYYNPDDQLKAMLKAQAMKNRDLVLTFYKNPGPHKAMLPAELNLALQFWLTFGEPSQAQIDEVLAVVSPFGGQSEETFNTYYPAGSFEPNGRLPINFNGGYHTLASLYAAKGDVEGVIQCFEKMIASGQRNYFEVARVFNNHINIMGYFYLYGYRDRVPRVVEWVSTNTVDNPPLTLYRNAAIRSGYLFHIYNINIIKAYRAHRGYIHPNLYLAPRAVMDALFADYENEIQKIQGDSERNFQLAMNAKRKAMFLSKYHYDRQLPAPQQAMDQLFGKALAHYRLVDNTYLQTSQNLTIQYFGDGVRERPIKRKLLFVYPDYMDGWFARAYHSDAFFRYLQRNNLLAELYRQPEDFEILHVWVAKAFEKFPFFQTTYRNDFEIPDETFHALLDFASQAPSGRSFDKNLVCLVLANRNFERGDTEQGMMYYGLIDWGGLNNSASRYEYLERTFFLNQLKYLATHLAVAGKDAEATQTAERLDQPFQRVYAYIFMADRLYRNNFNPKTFVYLDSAVSLAKQIDFNTAPLDSRIDLLNLLSRIGSGPMNAIALDILRDIPEGQKNGAIQAMAEGIAFEGNFYRAVQLLPPSLTEDDDLFIRALILREYSKKRDRAAGIKTWQEADVLIDWNFSYTYFFPN
jgi:energy-coupling factor transporter ATP-binding protein EcfA2